MSLKNRHMRKGENCADICNLQQKFLIHLTQSLFFPSTFADHKTYSWAHTEKCGSFAVGEKNLTGLCSDYTFTSPGVHTHNLYSQLITQNS